MTSTLDLGPILVTGACGFVGGHLVRRLCGEGRQVRGLVRPGARHSLGETGATLIEADINDAVALADAAAGCASVFHLAAVTPAPGLPDKAYRQVNVEGTRTMLAVCRSSGVRRLVHSSTVGVYGRIRHVPATERSPTDPSGPYRASKLEGERLVREAAARGEAPAVIVRLTDLMGPGATSWLGLARALAGGGFRLVGGGRNRNQITFVSDAVEGLVNAALAPEVEGETFLIAGEEAPTVAHIVEVVRRALGAPPLAGTLPDWPFRAYVGLGEIVYRRMRRELPGVQRYGLALNDKVFSIEKARRRLGYRPLMPFDEGMARTIAWYRAEGLV